jgi:TetR/AcrR family transcriptional regulator, transcriptional repressor for nem operon
MSRTSTAKERLTDAALDMIWEQSYGATSVDSICERADVRKGSFYYFFKSKSDLAAAALDADWMKIKSRLDEIFSSTVPPLERLRHYFDFSYEHMVAMKEKCGCVLGCPLFTLGCEISTQDSVLRDKVQEILERKLSYFESAIRDAVALGLIDVSDPRSKARSLAALFEGTLTQARIQNNTELIRDLYGGALSLLGAKSVTAV